jgi:uncharacterized protein
MQRLLYTDLVKWKDDPDRKPLIVKGVRQCGKTWLLNTFSQDCFEDAAYFNFEKSADLCTIFEKDLEPQRIIEELGFQRGKKIEPGVTLLIFDEIQACPNAITSLKYFCEDLKTLHLVCAGSLLGTALAACKSFPVGKVDILTLRPLSFPEFLLASENSYLYEELKKKQIEDIPKSILPKLESLYREYLMTGGMPEVVNTWLTTRDISEVERILDAVLEMYQKDFARHVPKSDYPKVTLIWDSIPGQLAKDNKKFIFSHVKTGAKSRDLEDALQWLADAGLVYKVLKVDVPDYPLSKFADTTYFKLYFCDAGLLRRLSNFPAAALMSPDPQFAFMRGALTENFVLTELIAAKSVTPYFWKSGNKAEVDFVFQDDMLMIPIEAKASRNTQAKSLKEYRKRYKPTYALRASLELPGIHTDACGVVLDVPLYLLWNIDAYLVQ